MRPNVTSTIYSAFPGKCHQSVSILNQFSGNDNWSWFVEINVFHLVIIEYKQTQNCNNNVGQDCFLHPLIITMDEDRQIPGTELHSPRLIISIFWSRLLQTGGGHSAQLHLHLSFWRVFQSDWHVDIDCSESSVDLKTKRVIYTYLRSIKFDFLHILRIWLHTT